MRTYRNISIRENDPIKLVFCKSTDIPTGEWVTATDFEISQYFKDKDKNKNMTHPLIKKYQLSVRYYAKKGIVLDTRAAGKKFIQDRHIDVDLLIEVANEFYSEWIKILNQEKLKTKK
jgi:hypothetical protein